jgi:hypothetical protein
MIGTRRTVFRVNASELDVAVTSDAHSVAGRTSIRISAAPLPASCVDIDAAIFDARRVSFPSCGSISTRLACCKSNMHHFAALALTITLTSTCSFNQ